MKSKLGNVYFLISLTLLIINDWYLKAQYSNFITGKLSDFAGLLAFPFFFSVMFPTFKKHIHISSALLFVFWNSHFSQPLIQFMNDFGVPLNRTIDFTDNFALLSILLSYKTLNNSPIITFRPIINFLVIAISCFAFMATSISPREERVYMDINNLYKFEISKSELLTRFNLIQIRTIDNLNKSSGKVVFDSVKSIFHYKGSADTLAIIYDNSIFQNQDSLNIKTVFGSFTISGKKDNSVIRLNNVIRLVPKFSQKNYRSKAIKIFEKKIVKKLRNY